jgi:hypothetical protein
MNLLTIFIFVLIIVLIYTVYKLMTATTTSVSGFSDASQATTVTSDKLGSSPNFGFSAWVYIDAWQNTTGTTATATSTVYKKNILTRCNGTTPIFQMHLDNDQNNLMLSFPGTSTTSTTCTIQNVKLQKWFNVIMSVYGNTSDLYLDGKLVRTCILPGPVAPTASDTVQVGGGDITCTTASANNPGDLIGYISSVVYKNDYFTPDEAWSIYSAGYSGSGLFDFINRYKLSFSLLKDNQAVGTVSI